VAQTPLNRQRLLALFKLLSLRGCVAGLGENSSHEPAFDFRAFLEKSAPTVFLAVGPKEAQKEEGAVKVEAPDCSFDELLGVWEHLQQAILHQRVFCVDYKGVPRALEFASLHAHAVGPLVAQAEAGNGWGTASRKALDVFQAALTEGQTDQTEQVAKDSPTPTATQLWYQGWIGDRAALDALNRVGQLPALSYPEEAVPMRRIRQALATSHLSGAAAFAEFWPALQHRYIMEGLRALNLQFTPLSYSGQDYDNSAGRGYLTLVGAVQAALEAQHAEADED
jgi:hypothetical protein